MNNYLWSVGLFNETITLDSGKIDNITVRLSAKERASVCTIELTPLAKSTIEKILTEAKKRKGIKLPASLIDENEQNNNAVASGSGKGSLPGLENIPNKALFSAFLDMISYAEGTYPDGYNIFVGGTTFSDYSRHPDVVIAGNFLQGSGSSAAGRYQFLTTSWEEAVQSAKAEGVTIKDYTPESQNKGVYYWIKRQFSNAFGQISADRPADALRSLRNIWESFDLILKGQYGKTERQCLELYQKQKQKYVDGTQSRSAATAIENAFKQSVNRPGSGSSGSSGSGDSQSDNTPQGKLNRAKSLVPDIGCNERAYLDAVSYAIGTDTRGDLAYDINVQTPGRDALIVPSALIGRYSIPPNLWNDLRNGEKYDKTGQDRMLLKLLSFAGGYEKLQSGDILGANRELDEFIPQLPQGSSGDRVTFQQFLEYWEGKQKSCLSSTPLTSQTPGKPTEQVDEGEIIKIRVRTEGKIIEYTYYFESIVNYTIFGKSPDSKLDNQTTRNLFSGINEIELANILLKRNGFDLQISEDVTLAPARNYLITNRTDRDTLEKIYQRTGIKFNASGVLSAEARAEKSLPLKRLIITDYFDITFGNEAVAKEEDLNFPVDIDLLSTQEILALQPYQKLSLLSIYNIIPEALRFDEWILESITHEMQGRKSRLELTKFIRKDEDEKKNNTGENANFGGPTNEKEFAMPIASPVVTSEFNPVRVHPLTGQIRPHKGIDLVSGTGNPTEDIKASKSGKVEVLSDPGGYGTFIVIVHGNGEETVYAHLSKASVSNGAQVKQGAIIGKMGSSGSSSGPHLHFEILINGKAENPRKYLKF